MPPIVERSDRVNVSYPAWTGLVARPRQVNTWSRPAGRPPDWLGRIRRSFLRHAIGHQPAEGFSPEDGDASRVVIDYV
jgi:hypothetical protein